MPDLRADRRLRVAVGGCLARLRSNSCRLLVTNALGDIGRWGGRVGMKTSQGYRKFMQLIHSERIAYPASPSRPAAPRPSH